MKVESKPFGEIEVDERQRIEFPFGIFGFEHLKHFVLLDSNQTPFYWLQSLEEPDVAFVLIEPTFFREDFVLEIPGAELEEIGIEDTDDPLVFAIVTIPEDQAKMTANLQGPVIINKARRVGRQSITNSSEWGVKHYILDELASVRSQAC